MKKKVVLEEVHLVHQIKIKCTKGFILKPFVYLVLQQL